MSYTPQPGSAAFRAVQFLAEHASARGSVWFTTAKLAEAIGAEMRTLQSDLRNATAAKLVRHRVGNGRMWCWQQGLQHERRAAAPGEAVSDYPAGWFTEPVRAWWPDWQPYRLARDPAANPPTSTSPGRPSGNHQQENAACE